MAPAPRVSTVFLSTMVWVAACAGVMAGFSGCRRSAPQTPAVEPALAELQILKDGRFLFTYVEPNGTFATSDKPDIIPEPARKMVRVIDPAQTKPKESTSVYTVDVNELLKSGKAVARPLAREAFETSAMAQLPPGDSSPLAGRQPPPHRGPPAGGPDAGAIKSVPGTPVVTIYGTSWCGACRTARQYFAERKIPFADKDVEQDPAAARELGEKAARMGIPTDRVPVLDVRGRLLLGFDRARVEALLGDPT
ncbi:MAG: glutaredoxin family protein [Verrucomicrobiota bacterium]